ncbi:MAG: GDSL-type esterase/lipase family protein [Chitinophagaceae bacterium]
MKKINVILVFVFWTFVLLAQEQKPAFWNDIQAFKKQDSVSFPPKGEILFVGSSSFTMWKDVQDYFLAHIIINRGFGGSSLTDVTRYANDIILPYQPRQIVIYCGENDLAASDTVSAQIVFHRFKKLFELIRIQYPKAQISYISIKPSPSRSHLMPKMKEANLMIKDFLTKERKASFIDVYHSMLKSDGKPMEDIFLDDMLHMNKKGYAIWQKIIEPYLKIK